MIIIINKRVFIQRTQSIQKLQQLYDLSPRATFTCITIIIIIINTDLQHMHVYMLMSIGVCDIRCVMC